ncbi:MAG TPA: asparagine synthase-related protein [Steroidobacter sp.]|uniref:asparagine synthase-related protein n=1 Tax=Steroidobacter sp. TaxID=1978227 RepID=UPI002ED84A6A
MYRYLALVWNSRNLESVRTVAALSGTAPSTWTVAYECPGIKLFRTDARRTASVYPLDRNGGVIFGKLFESHAEAEVPREARFDTDEAQRVVRSGGRHVVERYWGSYFAIVHDEGARKHHVFRDPTGTLPCYSTTHRGVDVFFSDIEDALHCLPGPFSFDRDHLARWLYSRNLAREATGIENIHPLPAGECLTLHETTRTRARLWDPVAIAGAPMFEQPEEAARALRSAVQSTVNAWTSCYRNITHFLSGGLDSSIVAGCLGQAPGKPSLTLFNMAIEAGDAQQKVHMLGMDPATMEKMRAIVSHGDERRYARLVAQRWDLPLVERKRNPELNMQRLSDIPLRLSPPLYFSAMEADDAQLEIIKTHGAEAFFSGQSGDTVFCATRQPLPAIDYAHRHGLRPALWRHLRATSALSRDSLWSVLGKTLSHGLLRRRYVSQSQTFLQTTLLTPELETHLKQVERAFHDAHHEASAALPPGKQLLAQAVASVDYHEFVIHAAGLADNINPLDAQPVWEAALRIPTYTLLKGGTSRGLARYAFRDILPDEIRKRIAKGSGTAFYQHVVQKHRALLREQLLDGHLVTDRYLDRRKLEECLAADDPSTLMRAATLLCYLSAEIWMQQWKQVGTATAARYRNAVS